MKEQKRYFLIDGICYSKGSNFEKPLCDLNGFVEHLEEYKIAGKIYATNVMEAGVNYLCWKSGYGVGITPLLDSEGKVIVTK